jgi:deoxyadenosine/deoxycytidine kinase
MMRQIIYIEGNIGTGKSTFVEKLGNYISQMLSKKMFYPTLVQEPVDEWMKTYDQDGKNILEKFYEDQNRWSFTFQMNSFISRSHCIEESCDAIRDDATKESLTPLILAERSIYTDRFCFAQNCHENGNMTKLEYDVYCRWNDWLSNKFSLRPKAYIYLRCPPEENVHRIKKRSRDGECGIPVEYLTMLHSLHDNWMRNEKVSTPVLTIDAMQNFHDEEVMGKIFEEVDEFIHSLDKD